MNALLIFQKKKSCFFYEQCSNCYVVGVSLARENATEVTIKLQNTDSVSLNGFVQATRKGISFIPFQTVVLH